MNKKKCDASKNSPSLLKFKMSLALQDRKYKEKSAKGF